MCQQQIRVISLKVLQICKNGVTKEPCLHVFQWHAGHSPTQKELITNIRISKCSFKISWEDCSQQRIWKWHPQHLCTVGDCEAKIFHFWIDDKAVIRYVTVSKIWWFFITHVIPSCNLMRLSLTCTELWDLLSHCLLWNGLTPHAKSFLYFCNN